MEGESRIVHIDHLCQWLDEPKGPNAISDDQATAETSLNVVKSDGTESADLQQNNGNASDVLTDTGNLPPRHSQQEHKMTKRLIEELN